MTQTEPAMMLVVRFHEPDDIRPGAGSPEAEALAQSTAMARTAA